MQPRAVSFEESITALREALADLLEKTFSDYQKAAQVLSGIDLDSGERTQGPSPTSLNAFFFPRSTIRGSRRTSCNALAYLNKRLCVCVCRHAYHRPHLQAQHQRTHRYVVS